MLFCALVCYGTKSCSVLQICAAVAILCAELLLCGNDNMTLPRQTDLVFVCVKQWRKKLKRAHEDKQE